MFLAVVVVVVLVLALAAAGAVALMRLLRAELSAQRAETREELAARSSEISRRLEGALRPPKARGGVGELLLANVLRDSLPTDAYELQHTFRTGERVDAVVRADKLVPIDAKFPLENFERVAIATKYIRPADGTFDFALMYLPSESIYYELVCGKTGGLYAYSLGKRVFPVSPSTFHAYL